jgi:hypothetical protein
MECVNSYLQNKFDRCLPIQINKRVRIRNGLICIIIEALIRLFPSRTYMGICMLLDHTPMCVIKATGYPNKLASFLTPGILNETEALSVARAGSHGIPIGFQGIFTGLEERQPTFNLNRFESVL